MATLADMMEDYRNYTGRLGWQRGKDIERMVGGDPEKAALLEQIMSLGEGGGHSIGGGGSIGLAGMVKKNKFKPDSYLYPVSPIKKEIVDLPESVGASYGKEINPDTDEEYMLIDLLETPKELRGQGLGRLAMRKAIADIQQEYPKMPIRLAAYPVEGETDLNRLVRFYEHEGFDVIDDSGPSVIMEHDNKVRPIETYLRPKKGYYEFSE